MKQPEVGIKCPGHVKASSLHQERCCSAWTTGLLKGGPQVALGQWQLHAVALHSLRWAANNGSCMVWCYIVCAGQRRPCKATEKYKSGLSEGDVTLFRLLTRGHATDQLDKCGVGQLNILSIALV